MCQAKDVGCRLNQRKSPNWYRHYTNPSVNGSSLKVMDKIRFKLIIATVRTDVTHRIVDTAKDAGATIIPSRGTGIVGV